MPFDPAFDWRFGPHVIEHFEILEDVPFADGASFSGHTYRLLQGRMHGKVDPLDSANAAIVDLELAPRDADGFVRYRADVTLIKPTAGPAAAALVEVPNRGNRLMARSFHRVVTLSPADTLLPGDGWLLHRGLELVSIGWQWDAQGEHAMRIDVPEARMAESPVSGEVMVELRPDSTTPSLRLISLGQERPSYPVHDPESSLSRLLVRQFEDDQPQTIPREQWRFARVCDGDEIPSDIHITLDGGFEPGLIYQLVYETCAAPVVGLGLLAIRDCAAWRRANGVGHLFGFGVSQTGRVLRHFLYAGLNCGEDGQQVYDGLLVHIAGGQRGDFNHRFAQPTVAAVPSFGQRFPFAGPVLSDPFTGTRDGLYALSMQQACMPKVIFTNTSWEYWRGDAALTHVSSDGTYDLDEAENSRAYMFAGTHHIGGLLIQGAQLKQLPLGIAVAEGLNVVVFAPLLRAAFANLEAWVRDGVAPPHSRVPRLADGTLVTRNEVIDRFAGLLPSAKLLDPDKLPRLRRMDLGPASADGVGDLLPPAEFEAYPALVAAVDDDLNERAGIQLPDISVPVGSHTGWNPRAESAGAPDQPAIFAGFTRFFAPDAEAAAAAGDLRRSIAERYSSRDEYEGKVRDAAGRLVAERLLLAEDLDWVVDNALARYDAATG